MGIQNWSEKIVVAELGEDPQFSDDLAGIGERLSAKPADVVLNFSTVGFINSSNIAKLLRVRRQVASQGRRLILCGVSTQVWGVFMVTGLDKVFEFTNDISTALATIQLGGPSNKRA